MAVNEPESPQADAVRLELVREREQLVDAVDELRRRADVNAMVRSKLPLVLAGSLAAGFVLTGGIGATMRLIFRHGREGRTVWRAGRYTLVRH
jgi:hypothetical protein